MNTKGFNRNESARPQADVVDIRLFRRGVVDNGYLYLKATGESYDPAAIAAGEAMAVVSPQVEAQPVVKTTVSEAAPMSDPETVISSSSSSIGDPAMDSMAAEARQIIHAMPVQSDNTLHIENYPKAS